MARHMGRLSVKRKKIADTNFEPKRLISTAENMRIDIARSKFQEPSFAATGVTRTIDRYKTSKESQRVGVIQFQLAKTHVFR